MSKLIFIFTFIFLSTSTYANRIPNLPTLNSARCAEVTSHSDLYEEIALKHDAGCITKEEEEFAIEKDYFIACMFNQKTQTFSPHAICKF